MTYLPELLTIATIHLLGVMSPGPDFIMICRNSVAYSRSTGIYSAVGLGLGILVHVFYSLVGIGFIISQSVFVFSVIKLIGAAYLIYIGFQSLRAQEHTVNTQTAASKEEITPRRAIRIGFVTNVTNPKVTLFFLALFTQVINPATPLFVQLIYGLEMALATTAWFTLVALLLTNPLMQKRFTRIQYKLERLFGVILIALGVKVALSSSE